MKKKSIKENEIMLLQITNFPKSYYYLLRQMVGNEIMKNPKSNPSASTLARKILINGINNLKNEMDKEIKNEQLYGYPPA